jgi:hypothetical protein
VQPVDPEHVWLHAVVDMQAWLFAHGAAAN